MGLEVIELDANNEYPDSCFVEDTAVIQNNRALICRLGEPSRRGEVETIEQILKQYFEVNRLKEPHTLEGGDVIHLENYLISGISKRTSKTGTQELSKFIGQRVETIHDQNITHLKSYISYLGNNTILTTRTYASHPVLSKFNRLIVPNVENYAANVLVVNGVIAIPKGYPNVKQSIREQGFDVFELEISEFEKCEGALTCLSLLF